MPTSPAPTPATKPPVPARDAALARIAGVTVPLFSLRTARSWGIGEIGDLPDFAAWARGAGLSIVQLLPLGEIPGGETSPYAALSAFGIDPMYVSVGAIVGEHLDEAIGGSTARAMLETARAAARVDYGVVRLLKRRALAWAFDRFEAEGEDAGRDALAAFAEEHASWLDDYALYRAIKDAHDGLPWWLWSKPLAARDETALAAARAGLAREARFYAWVQWVAHRQWAEARARLRSLGIALMGDLPFMVGRDSADVWSKRDEFRDDRSVGVPGDAFSEDGQDWDLPPYDWAKMSANDFAWLRRRCRTTASLYDRFRIHYLVGFYRTYSRPKEDKVDELGKLVAGTFDPATEAEQLAHGERVVGAMQRAAEEGGARLVAEDLGAVPPFVRESLAALGLPGYKVLIWEKDDHVFREPAAYPYASVACFGTHDTDPVARWWESRDDEERAAVLALEPLASRAADLGPAYDARVHRALCDLLAGANSELALFLVQDVLASRERINLPGTTGGQNWTWRLPAPIEALASDPVVLALTGALRAALEAAGRGDTESVRGSTRSRARRR